MVKALIIKPDGEATIEQLDGALRTYQQLVDGNIEGVGGSNWFAFMNTDGKIRRLDVNVPATELARACGWLGHRQDYFAGTVVFVGPADRRGDDTDVPESVLARARSMAESG